MAEVPGRDQLDTDLRMTIEWNFGQICDAIKALSPATLSPEQSETLQRVVRRHGNNAIRVAGAHLQNYTITRRPETQKPNINRVAKKAMQENGAP